jgi:hypothetical protein
MALYVANGASWTLVPEEAGKAYVPQGAAWKEVQEIWVARLVPPGLVDLEWARAFRVIPPPPTGVKPSLQQWDAGAPTLTGGDVRAEWLNATSDYSAQVEWEVNSVTVDFTNVSTGGNSALLDRSYLSSFDDVRARMRYFLGSTPGDWSAWSDILTYFV